MRPLHALFALLACTCLCAFANDKISIQFPAGWSEPKEDGATTQSTAPEASGRAWCRVNSVPLAALEKQTPQQLDASYGQPLDHETWAGFLSVGADKFRETKGEVRHVDGHLVQVAQLDFEPDVMGYAVRVRWYAYILPGRVVNGACFAAIDDYARNLDTFESTLATLRPQ